ncbi:MAG: hypothetical protein Q8R53_03625, partial [Nanoarchaeota archaeon]|nr:hypothetical protein [Nanoarchaeota archaeon]
LYKLVEHFFIVVTFYRRKEVLFMKKKMIFLVAGVLVILLLVVSCTSGPSEGGLAGKAVTTEFKANSCDADGVCEVAKTVSTKVGSTSNLILMSDTKVVNVQGNLGVDGSLSAGSVRLSGKTVSTTAGSTSALLLTSDAKIVVIEGSLSANSLAGTGNAYACVDSAGKLFRKISPCN